MAVRRRTMPIPWLIGSLGLCIAGVVLIISALSAPDFNGTAPARAHMLTWFGRLLNDAAASLEDILRPNGARLRPARRQPGTAAPPIDPVVALGLNPAGLREALPYYKRGDIALGDAQAARATDPLVRTALEWVALRNGRGVAEDRFQAFLAAHPHWPARDFLIRRVEDGFYEGRADPAVIARFFTHHAAETTLGRLAEARALRSAGNESAAKALVREVWHRARLRAALETHMRAEFGAYLTPADYRFRAERLLYEGDTAAGLRNAALVSPDFVVLARLLAATDTESADEKTFDAVPPDMRSDPVFLFARIHRLRHENKIREAATLMLGAPRALARIVDGDAWWTERRLLARKLLDAGDPATAYEICAENSAESPAAKIEAEFHAGWIALRFLNDPERAAKHFDIAAAAAQTPISVARIAYWQGRAAEALPGEAAELRARAYYAKAAEHSATYYGQLARARLGLASVALRGLAAPPARGAARAEVVRVIELFFAIGEKDLAMALASCAAKHLTDDAQIAALAKVVAAQHDAHEAIIIGKILAQRNIMVDALAFPTYGIPAYAPVADSAPPPLVYAIARQESEFNIHAVSSAGARGLMQMIESTARRTAARLKLGFDAGRLLSDAAFSAKLGAAHLGQLLQEEHGSPILVFAAYNAGGGHVKDWIDAYGDPRSPGVDPVDWVERIPFTETRNYVQRVMENWNMYRARFAAQEAQKEEPGKTRAADTETAKPQTTARGTTHGTTHGSKIDAARIDAALEAPAKL